MARIVSLWSPLARLLAATLGVALIVFLAAWLAIVATKHDLPIAGFWPANAIAVIALVRTRARSRTLAFLGAIPLAMVAANLAGGNTFADTAWFTAGNLVEVAVAYAVLRSRVFSGAIDGAHMRLVGLLQRLLVAALAAPAFGALVGAYGLSLAHDLGMAELWLRWWLSSALSLLLVAPFGLLLSRKDLDRLRQPRALGELVLIVALLAIGLGSIFVTGRMAMTMATAPAIMLAAWRLRSLGAVTTIAIVACVLVPLAASPAGLRFSIWTKSDQLLAVVEGYLLIQSVLALAAVAILNERDALIDALEARRESAGKQARARLRLLMNTAHEIRTPLNAIQGCAGLLERAGPLTPKQSELVEAVTGASRQLQALANDLLETARLEQGALSIAQELLTPEPILAAAAAEVRASLGSTVRIVMSAPREVTVWADPLRFRQVAANLISNALKFAGAYGPIYVSVRDAGNAAVLEVHDQGPGFPPGSEHSAFEPFAQSRRTDATGAGLGLSIVKQLVQAHGGAVRLISTPFIETRLEASFPHQASAEAEHARIVRAAQDSIDPDVVFKPPPPPVKKS